MAGDNRFTAFIRRIRAGDEQAARSLVQQYESAIRLEVRLRLKDPRLRRVFDSLDICQSVLASFFERAAAGQFALDQPQQVLRLLVIIARNKVAHQARRQRCQRRDIRRIEPLDPARWEEAAPGPGPSEMVASQELLDAFHERLTAEERKLADARAQGRTWADIAAEHGGTPKARRMQLARASQRVARQLGLDQEML